MGGKKKQTAQRSKNNTRPSSSAHSAELLGSFEVSGLKDTSLILSSFSLPFEELDSSVDSNFQLVLKKMTKKDSTTKLKALQEFSELCKNSDPEIVKTILPFWPRIYSKLATDFEHKVREAVHIAHLEVVIKVKRNLAPYLKQLAGAWFTSQYDTYPPAASAAKKAFEMAFPPNKVNDAVTFCQEEILLYIHDNIIVETAQSMSGSKTTSTEEAEAKYHRVLVSSLQGYALYLKTVSAEGVTKVLELNLRIVKNQKFWKIPKTKDALIKSAWYAIISALCQKTPFLLENESAHVVGNVLGNLDEGDPSVLPSFWEAVLSTITTIEEWWKFINVEKVILNKLWKILREGGQGNASVIYPNLLPLLSHFPSLNDMKSFYSAFFENLRNGLKYKTALSSKSEAIAVSSAFVECLQYVILRNKNNVQLCEKLIKMQLIPSIEWAFNEPQATYKTLFNQISTVVQYWSRNVNNPDVSEYSNYLQFFWNNLESLFQGLMMNLEQNFETDIVSTFANKQLEFFKSLKQITKPKKQMRVSFSNETQSDQPDSKSSKKDVFSEYYLDTLDNVILNVCKSYVKFINERKSKDLVQFLYFLLQDFESIKVLAFLKAQVDASSSDNVLDIFENLLLKWLDDDDISSVYVIDLVFLLLKHANEEEKCKILDSLLKIKDEQVFGWCIQKSLSYPYKEYTIIQKWIRKDEVGKILVEFSKRIILGNCPSDLKLSLKQVFGENENEELFISEGTVKEIINIFVNALSSPLDIASTLDACARFCAHISGAIYTEKFKLTYKDDLLLTLFKLSLKTGISKSVLTADTAWEIRNVWQDVISMLTRELSIEDFKKLTVKFIDIIENVVLRQNCDLDFVMDRIVLLVKSVKFGNPLRIDDTMNLILKRPFLKKCEQEVTYLCKKAEYVKGKLSCPYEKFEELENIEESNISDYFTWSQLVSSMLCVKLQNEDDDNDENAEDNENEPRIIEYLSDKEEIISEIIYEIALAKTFVENYKNTQYYEKCFEQYKKIESNAIEIINFSDKEVERQVGSLVCRKMIKEGWIWSIACFVLVTEIYRKSHKLVFVEMLKNFRNYEHSQIGILHFNQLGSKSFDYDFVKYFDFVPVESVICLRNFLHCEDIDVQAAEVFAKIDKFKADEKFLLQGNDYSWEDFQITIEVIRLFSSIIQQNVDLLRSSRWDFVIVAYTTWLENIVKMKNQFEQMELESLLAAISELYISIKNHLHWLKDNVPNAAKTTLDEWKTLFAADVHKYKIDIWLHFVDYYQDIRKVPLKDITLLQKFGKSIEHLDYSYLLSKKDSSTPKWTTLVEKCCSILTHPLNTLQLWGYHLLSVLLPGLIEIDSNSFNSDTPQTIGLVIEHFEQLVVNTEEIVNSILHDFRLGEDSCIVQPFTDSYTYTFAYLLLWDIILKFCGSSSTELRYQYVDWIKNNDMLEKLLNNLFRLMPTEVIHQSNLKFKPFANLFLEKFSSDLTDSFLSVNIEHMVCYIYYQTVSQLPALVRQWWTGTESKVAQIVDRVTSVYISPTLCSQELSAVIQHEKNFKNMTVKVYPNVREVVAVYTVDEAQMELLITLPSNYPLKVPDIQCNKQICGTSHRQWILQLKTNVLHQNGRIWDGLSLWNNNLDKKFDGVEECYICFAVLHQGTYQLPKLSCSTCRKKFHSSCLYKWFSTSNKSTCPICRNLF